MTLTQLTDPTWVGVSLYSAWVPFSKQLQSPTYGTGPVATKEVDVALSGIVKLLKFSRTGFSITSSSLCRGKPMDLTGPC